MKVVLSSGVIKEMANDAVMAVLSNPALRSAVSLRYDEKHSVQVVATATRKVYRKATNRAGAVPIGEYTLTISRPPWWVRRRIRSLVYRMRAKNMPFDPPKMIYRMRRVAK